MMPASKFAIVPRSQKPTAVARKREASDAMQRALETKKAVERLCDVLDQLETRVETYKALVAELTARKKHAEARIERLEDEAIARIERAGLRQVPGTRRTLETKLAPPALEVVNDALVPDEYKREQVSISVDKVGLKKAMARGLECSGVRLSQKITLLRK